MSESIEAEIKATAAARARLSPLLSLVLDAIPGAADAAVIVTIVTEGWRTPIVIATDRHRIAVDMEQYAAKVRAEDPHDRGAK